MLLLGLTGGIATGKSTVAGFLDNYSSLFVIDADKIAHEVILPGSKAYKEIVKHFGPMCEQENPPLPPLVKPCRSEDGKTNDSCGEIDRAVLGKLVFGRPKELKFLNSIVHPAVRSCMFWKILRAWFTGYRVCVLDIPLLYEAKMELICQKTLVIACDYNTQYNRLLSRDGIRKDKNGKEVGNGLSPADASRRMASQLPVAEKAKWADIVIWNSGSLDDLRIKTAQTIEQIVPSLWRTWLELIPPIQISILIYTYIRRTIERDRREKKKAKL